MTRIEYKIPTHEPNSMFLGSNESRELYLSIHYKMNEFKAIDGKLQLN